MHSALDANDTQKPLSEGVGQCRGKRGVGMNNTKNNTKKALENHIILCLFEITYYACAYRHIHMCIVCIYLYTK